MNMKSGKRFNFANFENNFHYSKTVKKATYFQLYVLEINCWRMKKIWSTHSILATFKACCQGRFNSFLITCILQD